MAAIALQEHYRDFGNNVELTAKGSVLHIMDLPGVTMLLNRYTQPLTPDKSPLNIVHPESARFDKEQIFLSFYNDLCFLSKYLEKHLKLFEDGVSLEQRQRLLNNFDQIGSEFGLEVSKMPAPIVRFLSSLSGNPRATSEQSTDSGSWSYPHFNYDLLEGLKMPAPMDILGRVAKRSELLELRDEPILSPRQFVADAKHKDVFDDKGRVITDAPLPWIRQAVVTPLITAGLYVGIINFAGTTIPQLADMYPGFVLAGFCACTYVASKVWLKIVESQIKRASNLLKSLNLGNHKSKGFNYVMAGFERLMDVSALILGYREKSHQAQDLLSKAFPFPYGGEETGRKLRGEKLDGLRKDPFPDTLTERRDATARMAVALNRYDRHFNVARSPHLDVYANQEALPRKYAIADKIISKIPLIGALSGFEFSRELSQKISSRYFGAVKTLKNYVANGGNRSPEGHKKELLDNKTAFANFNDSVSDMLARFKYGGVDLVGRLSLVIGAGGVVFQIVSSAISIFR